MDLFHRFISAPIGDDVREIANKLGTEQKTVSPCTWYPQKVIRGTFTPQRYQ